MVATKTTKDSNDSPSKAEQKELVEQIKKSSNILITVSRNPSVDALSAALGLTAIIDKMEKHGTAIFSGKVPPAIKFLNPDKIFEDTADSLRDFIIALSRDKADHLRYKVDGDVVKIYVTPYKTVITEKDLEFSQGDYNVQLVIALGVGNQKDLDAALAAHGRILHDATVTTINVGEAESKLGVINLHAKEASSLSEVVADIGEELSIGEKEKLIDDQIATALMTGIVATTDRFKSENTSARTMTVAASLMAAGADQQLISAQLEEAKEEKSTPEEASGSTADNQEASSDNEQQDSSGGTANEDGSLSIKHDDKSTASRLVVSTLSPDEEAIETVSASVSESKQEASVPTATEILNQLAAQEAIEKNETIDIKAKEEPWVSPTPPVPPAAPSTKSARTYLVKDEEPEEDTKPSIVNNNIGISADNSILEGAPTRLSSEQSPSVGAEPLRDTSSVNTTIEPLNPIDPMAPPVVDPVPEGDDLPQFNVDQSAEAILQAALNSATPAAEMTVPAIPVSEDQPPVAPPELQSPLPPLPPQLDTLAPPPPPPPLPDFSTPPPPLPDFSASTPVPAAPTQEIPPASPVVSTLPPEDMILAGQNQSGGLPPNDPTQFRIPGQ